MTTSQKRTEILNDMCDLGQMCLKDGDIEQALHWLNLAASHGSDRANSALGTASAINRPTTSANRRD